MKLITYQTSGETRIGAQWHDWVIDLNRTYKAALRWHGVQDDLVIADARVPPSMIDLLHGGATSLQAAQHALTFVQEQGAQNPAGLQQQGMLWPLAEVAYLPPVLRPGKVICVGMNYYPFVESIGEPVPQYPTLFHKTATPLIGHGQSIMIPPITTQVVPEGEVAVIIGKTGKYIAHADAFDYIAGYTCANDVCARDLEFRTTQWTSGKMLDTFGPLGPALVTCDDIADPNALTLKTILNGDVIQSSRTAEMIFSIPHLVQEISTITTLHPGDVILTGTPTDLGAMASPIFLKPGDTISVEVEGIGTLTTPVIAEHR